MANKLCGLVLFSLLGNISHVRLKHYELAATSLHQER